jgi:hypothetical protein
MAVVDSPDLSRFACGGDLGRDAPVGAIRDGTIIELAVSTHARMGQLTEQYTAALGIISLYISREPSLGTQELVEVIRPAHR